MRPHANGNGRLHPHRGYDGQMAPEMVHPHMGGVWNVGVVVRGGQSARVSLASFFHILLYFFFLRRTAIQRSSPPCCS